MKIKNLKYTIVIEPDEDGFHGYVPSLKGLHAGDFTEEKTLKLVKEAIICYIESCIKHEDPIPKEPTEGYEMKVRLND